MDGEDPVLVEQRLGQRDIVVVRGPAAQPERGNRAVQPGIVGRQDLNLRKVAQRPDPAIAQRPQARLARRSADRRLKGQRGRDGELRGIVRRAGMNARPDVGAGRVLGRIGIDGGDALAPNVDRPDAERRADPFVEVDPDEIGIEIGQAEIELSDAVRRIDERIDPALAREPAISAIGRTSPVR